MNKPQQLLAHNSLLPFYMAWQLKPNGSDYNLSFSYRLENHQYVHLLIEKLQVLIQQKAYLRQTFSLSNGQLMIRIHEHLPAKINFLTSSSAEFSKLEQSLYKEPHDIHSESSIILNVVRFDDSNQCVLLFNIHHIIMDGHSLDLFITDLNSLIAGQKIHPETLNEYRSRLANETCLQEKVSDTVFADYVREINDISEKINYPTTNKEDVIWHYKNSLPSDIAEKLMCFNKQTQVSVFNLLLLAWGIFVSKIFNQHYALISYPVNLRIDKSISGCFVNLVTLPLNFQAEDTYLSLISAWQNKILFIKQTAKAKSINHPNIGKTTSFAYSNLVQPLELIVQNKWHTAKSYSQIAHSNLSIKYREKHGKLFFSCDMMTGLFPDYFASSLLPRFFHYLNQLLTSSTNLIYGTHLLFKEEEQQLLYDFNHTDTAYPDDKTLVDLFDEIVAKHPDKIAVQAFNGALSYLELNNKAENLASHLIQEKVKADDIIGILMDNRLEMIVSILAVLKSGAAYVPITYDTPAEKIAYILQKSNAKFLLTLPHLVEKMRLNITVIDMSQKKFSSIPYTKPSIKPYHLAYVIYTSGTTGEPKGVLIAHRSVVNYATYLINDNQLNASSIASKYAVFGFDASVIEIYPILLSGGKLCIVKDEDRIDPAKINLFFNENKISYAFLPTQFAELFFKFKNNSLANLIVGGDKLTKSTSQSYRVINAYGPTEATVQSHSFLVDKPYSNIPIGKPINNVKCYVVDAELNVLPIGVVGELMIGGISLARGYLNQDTLTAEKFVPNRYQTEEERIEGRNTCLYKTGDLVRWLPDGNLEYVGRNDSQVKIRGYRIEPGEIESKLANCPEIDQAVVLVKNHSSSNENHTCHKYLIAYYVANKKLDESKLRSYLATQLPEYMLPSALVHLDSLPLTINGKLDRNALLSYEIEQAYNYLPPKNEPELLICSAFAKVLGLKKVGVNQDFFKLGGSSIQAIALVSELHRNFKISLTDVFNLKTPMEIASNVPFVVDNLKKHLEKIKCIYPHKKSEVVINSRLEKELSTYYSSIEKLPTDYTRKPISGVLLTGATGFLGCNLLNELLSLTDYKLFLLIRANSHQTAFERINRKFQFYFDNNLDHFYNQRLFVFSGDIEKEHLGLSKEEYEQLAMRVDSIIHSAALTKHYGDYSTFYSANVQATINLLELSKLTQLKDFHYVSTISVLTHGHIQNSDPYTFTEDDVISHSEKISNVYIKTKCEAENLVIQYRAYGITSNIYRVGNLAFMATNNRAQENIEDNGFFNRLKFLIKIGIIAEEMGTEQVSPVDLTARAIIKLFDKVSLHHYVHHVFNPMLCHVAKIFSKERALAVKIVSMDQFIDTIIQLLETTNQKTVIERFLLHQGWLNEWPIKPNLLQILQDKTQYMLEQLDFKWSPIDIEVTKMIKKVKILEDLERITAILPTPIYWEDVNSVVLGANEQVFKASGALLPEAYIGKTLYELYPEEMADHIKQHNEKVMETGETLSQEEMIQDIETGEIKYFNAVKAPLRDDDGNIIGIVGTSVDITAEKKAAHLKLTHLKLELENEVHKNLAQEQKKFMNIANQVAHDIRSPLASLLMIIKSCTEIPEAERIALREAAIGIGDIANHLLSQYQENEIDACSEIRDSQPILVSALLSQLLTDKKYQYQDLSVKFNHNFNQSGQLCFIKMQPSAFKRMISNIINNGVDAVNQSDGKLDVFLEADNEWVKIRIQDNGQGMPAALVEKLINGVAITVGKKDGHGIGLIQVHDTLKNNHGELTIDSVLGQGTVMTLTFPRISPPHWIAEEIQLREDDTVIILDDDQSIHGAWATHFEPILNKVPSIQLKHFQTANETLAFIHALSPTEKQKIFLLTDYELLKEELNGLQVITKSQIQRSILVTSHYANALVCEQAEKTGTKILPKQLASEIPIHVDKINERSGSAKAPNKVDAVIVDDNKHFVDSFIFCMFAEDCVVDPYYHPDHFLDNVDQYPKDTKIYLDHNFANSRLTGIDIAKKLYEQGYQYLHLLSGDAFEQHEIPNYLIVIRKNNLVAMNEL